MGDLSHSAKFLVRMARQLCVRANTHTHCLDGIFPGSEAMQMMVHISSCRSRGSRMLPFTFIHWLRPPASVDWSRCHYILRNHHRTNYLARIDKSCLSVIFTDVWRIGAAELNSFPMVDHSDSDRWVTACLAKCLGSASQPHRIEPMSLSLRASVPAYLAIFFSVRLL